MDKLLAEHNLTTLRGNDQLVQARAAGGAFGGFEEGWLGFRPTYKSAAPPFSGTVTPIPMDNP